jgi:hypothetical protein
MTIALSSRTRRAAVRRRESRQARTDRIGRRSRPPAREKVAHNAAATEPVASHDRRAQALVPGFVSG